jgi:hypothetical protein
MPRKKINKRDTVVVAIRIPKEANEWLERTAAKVQRNRGNLIWTMICETRAEWKKRGICD